MAAFVAVLVRTCCGASSMSTPQSHCVPFVVPTDHAGALHGGCLRVRHAAAWVPAVWPVCGVCDDAAAALPATRPESGQAYVACAVFPSGLFVLMSLVCFQQMELLSVVA